MRAAVLAAGLGALAAAAQPAARQRQEDFAAHLPPGEGRTLVIKQCTGCHDNMRGVLQLRAGAAKWEALVLDMGARGAPIMLEDVDPLVKYLSTVFGPTAPPFTDANTAGKADLIKLPGVTPAAADRLIAARTATPLTSVEQVRAALGLDASAFEKIKYYVHADTGVPTGNR